MGDLAELLASDQRGTLQFFITGLKEVAGVNAERKELLYTASVLAHFAQTSTVTDSGFSTPANLSAIFDQFVIGGMDIPDSEILENAGAQTLFMAGFFQAQMKRRHNVRWFCDMGRTFFGKAADLQHNCPNKREILGRMSESFHPWAEILSRLQTKFRDDRLDISKH